MTKLTNDMYTIFDRDEFSFKKLKEQYSEKEIAQIKVQFKDVWQIWKEVNLNISQQLPKFAKVHV
ncbi:glucose-6-phosphate 1-dehydrogenase [Lactobacillus crispatus]|nr:glucose-6-phosphate 1-dehydrogenase [Lactobacillus crispatus]